MSRRRITVTLTEAEAMALVHVAGGMADHPDVMESLFPDGRRRAVAYRAVQKLEDAAQPAFRRYVEARRKETAND